MANTKGTTFADSARPCPKDRVNRHFKAQRPNQLWVSDFTYVSTWQGWLYVAFVLDVFAQRIVGWRVSRSATTGFVVDALEQDLYERRPQAHELIHHSDWEAKYVSIRHAERLTLAGIQSSVGGKVDSYDNALAETINSLYKTNSFTSVDCGGPLNRLSWPRCNVRTGITTRDCYKLLIRYGQWRQRLTTTTMSVSSPD